MNNDTCGSDEFGGESIKDNVVTKNYAELAEALIEHNNSKKTKKSDIIKTEILSIGKHSNVGEAIVKYLLNNTSKFISGPMGWNSEVFESVEDWAVMRSLGIMEEFRAKYPDRNLVNECQGMQIVLDITNEEDLKIISIEKIDVKNTKEKVFEFLNVDDYKKYFVKILSGIFDKELNDAKEMQVIDIENSNTNDILSEDQIVKFREVKYMIGEVIGESSNSKEEVLKSYMDRVVEEMFNKCKKDGSCNDIENSVFNKIFEL